MGKTSRPGAVSNRAWTARVPAHRQLVKQLDRLVQLAQQFQGGGHTQHLQYGGRGSISGVVTQAAQVG